MTRTTRIGIVPDSDERQAGKHSEAERDGFTRPPRYDTYFAGWVHGWAARDPEVAQLKADRARLEADCDRLYGHAFDTSAARSRRLDSAAEDYWQRLMTGEFDLNDVDIDAARIARTEWSGGEAA